MPVDDSLHTDYVPSIFSHTPVPLKALKQKQERLERAMKRRQLKVDKQANKSRQLKVDGKLSTKSNRSTAESLVMSMAVKSKESAAKALAMPCTCTSSTDTLR